MKIRISILALLLFIVTALKVKGKDTQTDTLTFEMKANLIVIKGAINGMETLFVFDTGAYAGVLNNKQATANNIINTDNKNVRDSNNQKKKMGRGKIDKLTIGSFNFEHIESVIYDMPFLACNNYYLLGGDIINQLNWKFDFTNNKVYISKLTFLPSNEMNVLPVQFINNRHFTDLEVGGKSIKYLIDFGYSGVLDAPNDESNIAKISAQKQKELRLLQSQSTSMGLGSMVIGQKMSTFYIDSIVLGKSTFKNIKVNVKEKTDKKIGFRFFKENLSIVILNNTDKKYWLLPLKTPTKTDLGFDADYFLIDGKLQIVGKNLNENSSAKLLTVGDEIKSVNGKTAASFADECSFIIWRQEQGTNKNLTIETLKGEKLEILKTTF